MSKNSFFQDIRNGIKETKKKKVQPQDSFDPAVTPGRNPVDPAVEGVTGDTAYPEYKTGKENDEDENNVASWSDLEIQAALADSREPHRSPSVVSLPRSSKEFSKFLQDERRKSVEDGRSNRSVNSVPPEDYSEANTHDRLVTENKLLRIELDDLNNTVVMLKHQKENHQRQINESRKQKEDTEKMFRQELNELKERLKELDVNQESHSKQLEQHKKEKELVRAENLRLKAELEKKPLKTKDPEVKPGKPEVKPGNPRGKISTPEEKKSAPEVKPFQQEKQQDKPSPDVAKLKAEIARKGKVIEKLESDMKTLKQNSNNQSLKGELEKSKEEVEKLKGILKKKSSALEDASKKSDELKKANEELKRMNEELKQNSVSPEKETELKTEIQELTSTLAEKEKELQNAFKNAAKSTQQMQATIEKLNNEVEETSSQLQAAMEENETLRSNNLSKEKERELRDEIKNHVSTLKSKESEMADSVREKHRLMEENKELHRKLEQLKERTMETQKENQEMAEVMEAMKNEFVSVKKEKEKLKERLQENKEQVAMMKPAVSDDSVDRLKGHIGEQEQQISNLERKMNNLQNIIKEFQNEMDDIKEEVRHKDKAHKQPENNGYDQPDRTLSNNIPLQAPYGRIVMMSDTAKPVIPEIPYRPRAMVVSQVAPQLPPPSPNTLRELEDARKRLQSSNNRVNQLEKWLDEIYNNKKFDVVLRDGDKRAPNFAETGGHGNAPTKGRPKLPQLPESAHRTQYLLANGNNAVKTQKPGFNTNRDR